MYYRAIFRICSKVIIKFLFVLLLVLLNCRVLFLEFVVSLLAFMCAIDNPPTKSVKLRHGSKFLTLQRRYGDLLEYCPERIPSWSAFKLYDARFQEPCKRDGKAL